MELQKLSIEDLREYYNKFIELERYKLAERVKREINRRKYSEKEVERKQEGIWKTK